MGDLCDLGDWGHTPFSSSTTSQDIGILNPAAPLLRSGFRLLSGFVLPAAQKAVITPTVTSNLDLVVSVVPVRQPLSDEVVVRMCYSGICRSDACFSTGPLPGYPAIDHIAGHEGIGQVVKSCRPELLGRFVGLRYLGSTCGHCAYCLDGLLTSCPHQKNAPKQLSGSFQEYLTVQADCILLIPDQLISRAQQPEILCGAMCSGAAALMAVRAAKVLAHSVVVVVGAGGAIGHYTASIAKRVFGAKVIGVDISSKVEVMKENNHFEYADVLLSTPADQDSEEPWDLFFASLMETCESLRPEGATRMAADALIVAASSASAFRRLEGYVRDGGWIVCTGVPVGLKISLSIHDLVERNLHVTGSLMGGPSVSLEVMRYICDKQIQPKTVLVPMEDIPKQMQELVRCATLGKVVAKIQEPLKLPVIAHSAALQ